MNKEKAENDFKNQRGDQFTLILNDNELELLKSARHIVHELESNIWTIDFIACICHDKDIDEETKFLKTKHYHLIITFNGRYRIGTIIKWLTDIFKINENQISIDKCSNLIMQCRYLCHIDDQDKEQYDPQDIVSNNLANIKTYYNLDFIKSLPHCVQVVKAKHYDLETIMTEIANYDKYRKYINDLIVNHFRSR